MTQLPPNVQELSPFPPAIGGGMSEAGAPPTPGEILAMLRRRALMIFLLFTLFSAMAAGGFVALWVYFPGYSSESLIECISNIPETELTLEQQRLQADEHDRFVQTQAMLLKSPRILGEALKVNAVRETDWFKRVMARRDEPLLELDRDLSASQVRGTNFLRVSIQCRESDDPAVIVNEVVNQWYHDVKRRSAEDFATGSIEAAARERDEIRREIASKRERLRAIAQRLPAGALRNPGGNIIAQQVLVYGEQVARAQLELSQLEQYRQIYSNPDGGPITAEDRAIVEQDPQVAELTRAVFLLEQRLAADSEVFGSEHKEVRQLDAQLRAANDKIEKLRFEKLRERRADIREGANTAYANTQYSLLQSMERLKEVEAQQHDQDRLLFDYGELNSQLHRDIAYSDQLDEYLRGLNRVKAQRTAIRVNVAQPAIKPLQRSSPRKLLIPLGVFFAAVLSVGLALGLELLDKSVRTSQDVLRHLDVPLLGAIPHADDEEVAIENVETAVRDAPRSMIAEAFRRIRTSLQFSAPLERQRTIVVTCPQPEDGSTSVACNLALAVAQGGRRVLLVDANLRRPGISRVFSNVPKDGLSNILIGEGKLAAYAVKTDHPLLEVVGSGPIPPNPVDLLGGEHWRGFLAEAAEKYDQVIIDTPPALLASDAIVLATTVDGVVLVIRAKHNSRGVARRAFGLLRDVHAHVFGAVLNAAQIARGGYFREQLRAYYDYLPDADAAAATSPPQKS